MLLTVHPLLLCTAAASSSRLSPTASNIASSTSCNAIGEGTQPKQQCLSRGIVFRGLMSVGAGLALHGLAPHPSSAFSIGISGLKDWLKEQKKKTAEYLLAPIFASRDRLRSAILLTEVMSPATLVEAHKLVMVAARDCIKPEDGYLVGFQARIGVEVCTFRLILKNAASLLDDSDPVKLRADLALVDLINALNSLDGVIANASTGNASKREVADAFNHANNALDNFEKGVRGCLGIS